YPEYISYNDKRKTLYHTEFHAGNVHKYKLYHTSEFERTDYMEYESTLEEGLFSRKKPFLIYAKLKNGKYNIYMIDYLLLEFPNEEIIQENNSLLKDLDNVIKSGYDNLYLIEKNGLFTCYPLQKEFRYKKL